VPRAKQPINAVIIDIGDPVRLVRSPGAWGGTPQSGCDPLSPIQHRAPGQLVLAGLQRQVEPTRFLLWRRGGGKTARVGALQTGPPPALRLRAATPADRAAIRSFWGPASRCGRRPAAAGAYGVFAPEPVAAPGRPRAALPDPRGRRGVVVDSPFVNRGSDGLHVPPIILDTATVVQVPGVGVLHCWCLGGRKMGQSTVNHGIIVG
jgi:hypothetical protein